MRGEGGRRDEFSITWLSAVKNFGGGRRKGGGI